MKKITDRLVMRLQKEKNLTTKTEIQDKISEIVGDLIWIVLALGSGLVIRFLFL